MTTLDNLPNEVGRMIWRNMFLPDDIESYGLVCWHIRALAGDVVTNHHELRRHFTSIGNSQSILAGEIHATRYLEIYQLLELVTINPYHALYVKNLTIESWHQGFETEQEFNARLSAHGDPRNRDWGERPRFKRYPEKTMRILKQAVRGSRHLKQAVRDSTRFSLYSVRSWIDDVERGDEGPLLAVLLTVLPNLASLKIHEVGSNHHVVLGFMEHFTKFSIPIFLPNLTSVELPQTLARGNQHYCETFRIFFNLPSLRSLKASNLDDGSKEERHQIQMLSEEWNSDVTNLDLQGCTLTEECLQEVLSRFQSLESFTYSWPANTHKRAQFLPVALRCTLLEYNWPTLTRLDLKSNQGNSGSIGTLTEFIFLKYLRIEYPLLRLSPPLAEKLPPSLEEFHLHNESYKRSSLERLDFDEITEEMFGFGLLLLQNGSMRHPNLKTMTMKGNRSTEKRRLAVMALNERPDVSLTVL